MSNTASLFTFAAVFFPLFGVFGFLMQRRKRGAAAARSFGLWYAFVVIPLTACALCGMVFPKLHWLYYLAVATAVVSTLVQFRSLRRTRTHVRWIMSPRRPVPHVSMCIHLCRSRSRVYAHGLPWTRVNCD